MKCEEILNKLASLSTCKTNDEKKEQHLQIMYNELQQMARFPYLFTKLIEQSGKKVKFDAQLPHLIILFNAKTDQMIDFYDQNLQRRFRDGRHFSIVPVGLIPYSPGEEESTEDRHATMLLIDHKTKTIEYFEPNGTEAGFGDEPYQFLRKNLERPKEYKFIKPELFCPTVGWQAANNDNFCELWSYLYAYLRIICADIHPRRLQFFIVEQERPVLRNILHGFACLILNFRDSVSHLPEIPEIESPRVWDVLNHLSNLRNDGKEKTKEFEDLSYFKRKGHLLAGKVYMLLEDPADVKRLMEAEKVRDKVLEQTNSRESFGERYQVYIQKSSKSTEWVRAPSSFIPPAAKWEDESDLHDFANTNKTIRNALPHSIAFVEYGQSLIIFTREDEGDYYLHENGTLQPLTDHDTTLWLRISTILS